MFKYHTTKMEKYYDKVVDMYFNQGCSVGTIAKKNFVTEDTIRRWIRNFASENNHDNMDRNNMQGARNEQETNAELESLKKEISQLKKELKEADLRADIYDTMIDVAEESFKIQIRKKVGAK